jgi:hypothetical protein
MSSGSATIHIMSGRIQDIWYSIMAVKSYQITHWIHDHLVRWCSNSNPIWLHLQSFTDIFITKFVGWSLQIDSLQGFPSDFPAPQCRMPWRLPCNWAPCGPRRWNRPWPPCTLFHKIHPIPRLFHVISCYFMLFHVISPFQSSISFYIYI